MKYLKQFGLFWYDFVVGDSLALAIGGVLAIALSALLVAIGAAGFAQIVLPVTIIATIARSLAPGQTHAPGLVCIWCTDHF